MIGLTVEFSIGERSLLKDHSNGIGSLFHLALNELVHTQILWIVRLCGIPLYQQLFSLSLCEQGQIRQACLWVLHNSLKEGLEVCEHACDGSLLEEIRIIFQHT